MKVLTRKHKEQKHMSTNRDMVFIGIHVLPDTECEVKLDSQKHIEEQIHIEA